MGFELTTIYFVNKHSTKLVEKQRIMFYTIVVECSFTNPQKSQTLRLFLVKISLTFRQLQSVDRLKHSKILSKLSVKNVCLENSFLIVHTCFIKVFTKSVSPFILLAFITVAPFD